MLTNILPILMATIVKMAEKQTKSTKISACVYIVVGPLANFFLYHYLWQKIRQQVYIISMFMNVGIVYSEQNRLSRMDGHHINKYIHVQMSLD